MVLLLPEAVRMRLQHAFPHKPLGEPTPTFGGFSNLTIGIQLHGQPTIVKAATSAIKRADLRREAYILDLLAGSSLPIAPLLAVLDDDAWTIEVLGLLPGENGIQLLNAPLTERADLYCELARLLARVHTHQLLDTDQLDLCLPKRAEALLAALPELNLARPLNQALLRGLARAAEPRSALQLVHGDPGAHNILWQHGISALLDWEWAGAGEPLTDIAWICWTLRFRQIPEQVRTALLHAYGLTDPDPADLRDLALAQIAAILMRVADTPNARAEWLRRLEWTLSLPEYQ